MDDGLLEGEANLKSCLEDWSDLNKEFTQLEVGVDNFVM